MAAGTARDAACRIVIVEYRLRQDHHLDAELRNG
jgi:hypothetical protein